MHVYGSGEDGLKHIYSYCLLLERESKFDAHGFFLHVYVVWSGEDGDG